MEDRYLFKAKHIHVLPNNNHLDGSWVVGFLSGERYIANDSGEYLIDPSTICQCTGLKDKNGNLIWENDIVKKDFYTDYDAYANSEKYVGVVKFIDCAWAVETFRYEHKCTRPIFEAMAYSEDVKHFEVIGNIFDNPELLESEG